MGVVVEEPALDVVEFCRRHELDAAVKATLDLVAKYYPVAQRISAELVHDPDADADWVALNVEVDTPPQAILEHDAAFLDEWSATIGGHVLDRLVVMIYPADDGRS